MGKIYVVGMGPGKREYMTLEALNALESSDVIIGYTTYVDLIRDEYKDKELLTTGMRQEEMRCDICLEKAAEGHTVSLVCSGDAGIYGMVSLLLEKAGRVLEAEKPEIEIVAGVTAAISGAARLGAPLSNDFCVISLSDILTPWEKIESRLLGAMTGDYVIVIYNPSSHKRKGNLAKAYDILRSGIEDERPCGMVRNIGRENEEATLFPFSRLPETDADMFTTIFIGNSDTVMVGDRLVTPRGYHVR